MPVPVKFKCKKCGGETESSNTICIPCGLSVHLKEMKGVKHISGTIFTKH